MSIARQISLIQERLLAARAHSRKGNRDALAKELDILSHLHARLEEKSVRSGEQPSEIDATYEDAAARAIAAFQRELRNLLADENELRRARRIEGMIRDIEGEEGPVERAYTREGWTVPVVPVTDGQRQRRERMLQRYRETGR